MLRYHIAFHLPRAAGEMVVAEALDFPGAVAQGWDWPGFRIEREIGVTQRRR